MIVLALDTTTPAGSLALLRGGTVLETAAIPPGAPMATRLPGDASALLARHAVPIEQVEGFAVAIGPGSFTGLRIGVATMQGFAFARRRPLIGVSGLDALALAAGAGPGMTVATWVDAWRGEVYAACYRDGMAVGEPTVGLPQEVLAEVALAAAGGSVCFIGDGAARHRAAIEARARWTVTDPAVPLLAGAVAQIALGRLKAGERSGPEAVQPLYVRRPDVELARSARRGVEQARK